MYQALYRKYRPRAFEDVAGQEHITETLRRQVETGRVSHAYLFVGTRGTGKTTCAKILSRALNCQHPVHGDPCNECAACRGIASGSILDVVEIDAASNNGVDNIRAIREEAVYTPAEVKKRVYIIDEVHMLSASAFNALLKILEEPPEHLVFILATTELNKVPATILSRCQHFSFRRIAPEKIEARLRYVAEQEGFTLTDPACALLARLADGSMRDALSLLDQCVSSDTVDEGDVLRAVGLMGAENTVKLWESLRGGDSAGALELFEKIYYGGAEPSGVLNDILSLTRDMLMVRVAPTGSRSLLTGAYSPERLNSLSSGLDTPRLLSASEILQDASDAMRDARDKRTKAELTLLKLTGVLRGTYLPAGAFEPKPEAPRTPARQAPESARPPVPETPAVREEKPETRLPAAPESEEAPPPWDDADAPPEDPGSPAEGHGVPAAETAPEPAKAPAAPESDGWWGRVVEICRGTLEGSACNFLANRDNAVGSVSGGNLIVYTRNGFVKMMLDNAAVKNAVSQAAAQVLGRSLAVTVAEGMPQTAPDPGTRREDKLDKLDRLSQFDGIVKFK